MGGGRINYLSKGGGKFYEKDIVYNNYTDK
jgi:hypothetical protein